MILVTGGTGFVGRRVAEALVGHGHRVRILTRSSPLPVFRGAEAVRGDILEPATLDAAMADVEAVVHAAGVVAADGEGARETLVRANVDGTANVARAAVAAGVRRFVHISSASVYGHGRGVAALRETDAARPDSAYGRSKLDAESALTCATKAGSTSVVVLRPPGIYGPGRPATERLFRDVARKRVWFFGPFPVIVHPTHVRDLVAAVLATLALPDVRHGLFNVAGERALDYRELIRIAGATVGREPLVAQLPAISEPAVRMLAAALRAVGRSVAPSMQAGGVCLALDTTKARTELGLTPVPLEAGLAEVGASLRPPAAG